MLSVKQSIQIIMGNNKLRGKDLRKINYTNDIAISLAIDITSKHFKHHSKEEKLSALGNVLTSPENYLDDPLLHLLANELTEYRDEEKHEEIALLDQGIEFNYFGRSLIDDAAYDQMSLAMRLPIAENGALMPDAHHGYGLPIGGVLATKNKVIPYAVGLDIGCRMSLTIYDLDEKYLNRHSFAFCKAITDKTNFGTGGIFKTNQYHEIIDREEFNVIPILKNLRGKAAKQLGTSGSGNHFVEFGLVKLLKGNGLGLPEGEYVGLLAHSGSRGMGATIAQTYTDIAMSHCYLPRKVRNLAWLDMDHELGKEYWMAMNFAGDYATACHDQIHKNVAAPLGIKPIAKIENHHNFAWKEVHGGENLIVHRKGATPASKKDYGIIPGSMISPAFLVRGKGNEASLSSASHGAGRRLSRSKTKSSYTMSEMRKSLKNEKVTLIGGGVDEASVAYKDIHKVMSHQKDLVDVIGEFHPKIVRMDKP